MRIFLLAVLLASSFVVAVSPEYVNEFTRTDRNITLEYNTIPWVLMGVTPRLSHPQQIQYDIVVEDEPYWFDPQTCPGEIAVCYQIVEHSSQEEFTYGSNYSGTGSYTLPEKRIKTFYCVGNYTECTEHATRCFCTQHRLPPQEYLYEARPTCKESVHICRDSTYTFTLCEGTIEQCKAKYEECGCGLYSTCRTARTNLCLTDTSEMKVCAGELKDCLRNYRTCACETHLLSIRETCLDTVYNCSKNNGTHECAGDFEVCSLRNDWCEC